MNMNVPSDLSEEVEALRELIENVENPNRRIGMSQINMLFKYIFALRTENETLKRLAGELATHVGDYLAARVECPGTEAEEIEFRKLTASKDRFVASTVKPSGEGGK